MNGDGDMVYGGEDGDGSGWMFDVTQAERIAFGYADDVAHVLLHYSSRGGAPDLETATEAEMAEYLTRLEAGR
jgi:hypothetical protein